jgi:hypothetical protein
MSNEQNPHHSSADNKVPSQTFAEPCRVNTPAERVMPPVVHRLPGMESVKVQFSYPAESEVKPDH